MQSNPILFIIGLLLLVLSATMVIPMVIDLYMNHIDWKIFGICIIITGFFGSALILSNKHSFQRISLGQAFVLTTVSWPILTIFSALPFSLSQLDLSFTDAFFEAMSGITTTGATVLTDIESAPPGILIWRALLQWLGGIGIIITAISIFPFLGVGGMQLFKTHSSQNDNNMDTRVIRLCGNLTVFYTSLTILCMISYIIGGMSSFDAFAHALTTISSGGFSTYNNSFEVFVGRPWAEATAIIFMIISGLPFFIMIRAVLHGYQKLFNDTQVKTYLAIIAVSTLLLAFFFTVSDRYQGFDAISKSLFNSVSMLTGTGFSNTNTSAWGGFALCFIFFLMIIGGCAGSTSSGLKIFRINALYSVARAQVQGLIHPSGVFIPRYGKQTLGQETILSILSYFFAFTILLCIATLALSTLDLNLMTSLSAAVSALANVGPGFGSIIGPTATYATIPSAGKWILSACMLVGRLEIFTILVLFTPLFWKR